MIRQTYQCQSISFTVKLNLDALNFYTESHHHNHDHGASEHARQAGPLWKVGLLHPSYWVLFHSWGHSCKLWPRTLLKDTR